MYRHGDHVPHPHIQEMRAKIRVSIDAVRPLPVVADGEMPRHHARDLPGDPSIDPAQAMTADHETRRERLAAELAEDRLAAVVVAPSPDLVYLTGYDPMPLERLTALVIRPDGAAVLVVPELERQLALDSAAGQTLETNQVVGWRDGDDPYDWSRRSCHARDGWRSGTGCGRRMCSRLQRTAPALAFEPASRIIGRLRAVKDHDELGALRRAGRGADETFRQICGMRFLGRREEEIAEDLAALLLRARALPRRLHDRRLRSQRRFAASRAQRQDDLPEGRRRHGFRR